MSREGARDVPEMEPSLGSEVEDVGVGASRRHRPYNSATCPNASARCARSSSTTHWTYGPERAGRGHISGTTVPHHHRLPKRAAGAEGRAGAVASWAVDAVDVVQWIVHRIVRRHRAFSDPLQASLL